MPEKIFGFFLVVLTPIIGLISFTVIVKGSWSDQLVITLPLYQGLSAYFSLIALGFSYIPSRKNILGKKIIPLILGTIGLPVVFYICNGIQPGFVIPFVAILFLVTAISFINLTLGCRRTYLIFQCLVSASLPICMVLEKVYLLIICLLLFAFLFFKVYKRRNLFGSYSYSDGGLGHAKSLLIQSPLFLLPFFDILIVQKIGQANYENYAVINKYITGFFNLLFSYSQFRLLFGGGGVNSKVFVTSLVVLTPFVLSLSLYQNTWSFMLSIALLSLSMNISSLLIRKMLLDGISVHFSMLGPLSIAIYYGALIILDENIKDNNGLFIALMFIAVTFPILIKFASKKFLLGN